MRRSLTIIVLCMLSVLTAAVQLARHPGAPATPLASPQTVAAAGEDDTAAAETAPRDRLTDEGAPGWSAPRGSFFRFRMRDHLAMVMGAPDGSSRVSSELRTACTVTTTVLDRRDDEVLIRQEIEELSFAGTDGQPVEAGPAQQGLIAAAASPVLVRMNRDGRILGYGFADGLDGDQRNLLRGVLGSFDFESPRAGRTTWDSSIDDATGSCAVRYEALPADGDRVAVRRTRVRYTAIGAEPEVPAHEVSGVARAWFDAQRGWLCGARLDESLTVALPWFDLRASSHRVTELESIESGAAAVEDDVQAGWASASAPATGRFEPVGGSANSDYRRVWEQRLQGVTLDQVVADLARLVAASPVDREAVSARFQQLQWLIKLDDGAARELHVRITTRQLTDAASRVALAALGAAGTAAAQRVLAELRADPSVASTLREAATIACLQLADPEPTLVAGLCEEAAGNGDLRGIAMLVLGALAPRAPAVRVAERSPLEVLLAIEPRAEARGELDQWVLAMGNTRAPQALPIAQRLLGHPLPAVRGACCVALRQLAGQDALITLIERGLVDFDAGVRYEAVSALGRRPEPAARAAIEHVARIDPDAAVRGRASRLLARGE